MNNQIYKNAGAGVAGAGVAGAGVAGAGAGVAASTRQYYEKHKELAMKNQTSTNLSNEIILEKIKEKNLNITLKHSNMSTCHADIYAQKDTTEDVAQIRWLDVEKTQRQQALKYLYCPNCEATAGDIIRHGKTPSQKQPPKQKYKCKVCSKQFSTSLQTFIKRMSYRDAFEVEYMKDTNKYKDKYINATWSYLATKQGQDMVNDLIHHQFEGTIKDQADLDTFIYLLVHNAYHSCINEQSKLLYEEY